MQERVDPAILGGVVARVGDTLIDGSVKRRLMLLREQIVKGGGSFGGPQDGRPGSEPDGGPEAGGGPAADSGTGGPFVVSPAPDGGSTASGGSPDASSDDRQAEEPS